MLRTKEWKNQARLQKNVTVQILSPQTEKQDLKSR